MVFNKRKKKEELEKYKEMQPEEQVKELKKVIRLTYKSFQWIAIFLLIPTMGKYFIDWEAIPKAIDIGIVLLTISLWRINKKMEKKKKEDEA